MYKRKCHECGKQLLFKEDQKIKPFCCKECSDKWHEKDYNAPENGPVMPLLKKENITDEACISLVKAIVSNASHDVTHFKPGTQARVQAEKFFESEYFTALTGLEGETILQGLRGVTKKKKPETRKTKPSKKRKVRCIDTGVLYGNLKEAAVATGLHKSCIQGVCNNRRKSTGGLHWEYVEVET